MEIKLSEAVRKLEQQAASLSDEIKFLKGTLLVNYCPRKSSSTPQILSKEDAQKPLKEIVFKVLEWFHKNYKSNPLNWIDANSKEKPTLEKGNGSAEVLCHSIDGNVYFMGWYDYGLKEWRSLTHFIDENEVDFWAYLSPPKID